MQNVPVFLTVAGRACVVIGGGPVGTRKARMLLDAGARVTVVTPQATAELEHLARECGALSLLRRDYRPGDLAGSGLAFAATGVPEVQDQVATDAERERIWFNKSCLRLPTLFAAHDSAFLPIGNGGGQHG